MISIADIRKDYKLRSLEEKDTNSNAISQFDKWWQDALKSDIDEVNAFVLSTATKAGKPSSRVVLLKGFDENGFVFFTNYQSHKGKELAENPQASMVFFWKELERQVRIEGAIEKISPEKSDAYFFSRPEGSRIGAWSSSQSSVIENRDLLEENVAKYKAVFADKQIPRPDNWGGYCLKPALIEFWQGRSNRLHDRLQYTLLKDKKWLIERLAP